MTGDICEISLVGLMEFWENAHSSKEVRCYLDIYRCKLAHTIVHDCSIAIDTPNSSIYYKEWIVYNDVTVVV